MTQTPTANDFKIRHAFTGTRFHGAYMTDIIKGVEMVDSTRLLRHVRENPALLRTNVELFLAELAELGSVKPTIATFGSEAHRLVQENVPADKYSQLGRLVHYAHRISKENYRQSVLTVLGQLASDV